MSLINYKVEVKLKLIKYCFSAAGDGKLNKNDNGNNITFNTK